MNHPMTDIGREMLQFQEQLAKDYGYAPIGYNLFLGDLHQKYRDALPAWCSIEGASVPLSTLAGTVIAKGYSRIVIGDYGAFVEIPPDLMTLSPGEKFSLCIAPGQEYRVFDPRYKDRVKYIWYTVLDGSQVKIYFQRKTVSYADYRVGMYYISPYEVIPADQ